MFGETVCKFSDPPAKQPFEQIVIAQRKNDTKIAIPNNKLVLSVPSLINSHKPPLIGNKINKCFQ